MHLVKKKSRLAEEQKRGESGTRQEAPPEEAKQLPKRRLVVPQKAIKVVEKQPMISQSELLDLKQLLRNPVLKLSKSYKEADFEPQLILEELLIGSQISN